MFPISFLLGAASPAAPVVSSGPSLAVQVTGSCSAGVLTPDTLRLSWSLSFPDGGVSNYSDWQMHVFAGLSGSESDRGLVALTTTTFDFISTGQSGPNGFGPVSRTFRGWLRFTNLNTGETIDSSIASLTYTVKEGCS
jgi:hypothetical protein